MKRKTSDIRDQKIRNHKLFLCLKIFNGSFAAIVAQPLVYSAEYTGVKRKYLHRVDYFPDGGI